MPSAPTTSESSLPETEEDEDGESVGADEENSVPVEGEPTADGDGRSSIEQQRQQEQQEHPLVSTRKPPQPAHGGGSGGGNGGGGVRHHDIKQRHGSGKGSGSGSPACWLLVLTSAVVVTLFRLPTVSRC